MGAARAAKADDAVRAVADGAKAVDVGVRAAAVVPDKVGAAPVQAVEARGKVDAVRAKAARAVAERHPVHNR